MPSTPFVTKCASIETHRFPEDWDLVPSSAPSRVRIEYLPGSRLNPDLLSATQER